MINVESFVNALRDVGIDFFTGVPDSLLKSFCAYVTDNCGEKRVIAANEGGAFMLERWYKYPFVSAWRKNHKKDFMFTMNVLLARILRKVHSAIKHVRLGR